MVMLCPMRSTLQCKLQNILQNMNKTFATIARPSIHLSKEEVMVDEKVNIRVSGLHKQQKVTVLSSLLENKKNFASCGHFVADDHGQIDLSSHQCLGGSYTGIQPMGLFTSTKEVDGPSRLLKLDVNTPYDVTLSVHDGHTDCDKIAEDFLKTEVQPLAVTSLKRWYKAPGVRKIPIHEGKLHGSLLLPPGDGPFPGIVDIFGLAGGILDYRAALLASHGYAALSLAYIAYKDLPKSPDYVKVDYFLEACEWLASHPMVKPGGIGIVAHCVGGGIAACTATQSPLVKVLVNTNGNPMALMSMGFEINGVKVEGIKFNVSRATKTEEGIIQKSAYEHLDIQKYLIPVWEKDNMKTLMIVAEDDLCVEPNWQRILQDRIPESKKDNFRFVYYPGAGHLIEPPYSPYCKSTYNKILGVSHLWGGQVQPHLAAQEQAWSEILTFLNQHLASPSKL